MLVAISIQTAGSTEALTVWIEDIWGRAIRRAERGLAPRLPGASWHS
jgi:hypothetical protein